jgi:translation initiation factor 3 subunit D
MDNEHHTVLGTHVFKPAEFAQQINLNMQNCWGILKHLIELVNKYDAGKFVLIKDPNKSVRIRFHSRRYGLAVATFECA